MTCWSGRVYQYYGVPSKLHEQIMQAPSKATRQALLRAVPKVAAAPVQSLRGRRLEARNSTRLGVASP